MKTAAHKCSYNIFTEHGHNKDKLHLEIYGKKINKENKTLELIGCSPQELRNHIEKYFRKGMSWENYGIDTWHIDHIRPLSLAKSWDDIVRLKLMHYTNLRPLWAKENLQKSDK